MYQWERRLRLATGLVLAVFVTLHLANHALGIIGFEAMEAWRRFFSPFWDHPVVMWTLHGSLLTHISLALLRLYRRRTLRMSRWEWVQTGFGLSIAPLLAGHVIGTRVAAELAGFDPDYYFLATIIASSDRYALQMPVLLIVVWVHLIAGLHFWLRLKSWYRRTYPVWVVLAIALPLLAGVGVLRATLTASSWLDDRLFMQEVFASYGAMSQEQRGLLSGLETPVLWIMLGLLVGVLAAREARNWLRRFRSDVRISHANGRILMAHPGQTLLEALRVANIPHASVCGGRARCTTCRVRVGAGRDHLPPPGALEQAALTRIGADISIRLACQTRPSADVSITPLINPGSMPGQLPAGGGLQGTERHVVCMFVDMRGSTRMAERILPYDVVFILNQFFIELSASLRESGGHYAQFSGDGLMALYGLGSTDMRQAAHAALHGATGMFRRLERLNQRLVDEFDIDLRMGIGIHSGPAIVGNMGPPQGPLLTAIGDNINIAARLETASKTLGCDVVISRETMDLAQITLDTLRLREIEVRGREDGIEVVLFDAHALAGLVHQLAGPAPLPTTRSHNGHTISNNGTLTATTSNSRGRPRRQ